VGGSVRALRPPVSAAAPRGPAARRPSDDLNSDVELIVLRHQLLVLKRIAGRPRLRRRDRLFMAAMSKALHRARCCSFVVSPQTLLRWHREHVSVWKKPET